MSKLQKHGQGNAGSVSRPGAGDSYGLVVEAAKDFVHAWRTRPRYEMPPLFSLGITITVAIALSLIVLALILDANLARQMRGLPGSIYRIFAIVTDFGKSGYLFFFTALTVVIGIGLGNRGGAGRVRTGLYLLAGRATYLFSVLLISGLASQVLKRIGRARPRLLDEVGPFQFDPFSLSASWASFPSGHTITAFAFAMGLGYLLPKWRNHLLGAAALIGVSRIVLGAHYASDVVAGAWIGIVSAFLLQRAFASRAIVFTPDAGQIVARGGGVIVPALRKLLRI